MKERPPERKRIPPRRPAGLNRLAWWAWLTTRDDELAERLEEYCDGQPPWLDSVPWFLVGLLPGMMTGAAACLVVWPAAVAPLLERWSLGITLTLFVALALASRDHRGEEAAGFASRIAVTALHVPYVAAATAGWLGILGQVAQEGQAWDAETAIRGDLPWALALAGLALILFLGLSATTPRVVTVTEHDDTWPTLAGVPSLLFRVATLALYAVVIFLTIRPTPLWALGLVLIAPVGLTLRRQEQAVRRFGAWFDHGRLRRRHWPDRLEPTPFALEGALLAIDADLDARRLAVDYCDARDYPPEAVDQAVRSLWRGPKMGLPRARAAALCALELWTDPRSEKDAAYRGLARLEGIAQRQGRALDEAFWERVAELVAGTPRAAAACGLLTRLRDALGHEPDTTWHWLRHLRWAEALSEAPDADRHQFLDEVLELQREMLARPTFDRASHRQRRMTRALAEMLDDLDTWRERDPSADALLDERLQGLLGEILEDAVGRLKPPVRTTHPDYSLWLRWVSDRVAAGAVGPERWYEAARTFEGLPRVRQIELLTAFSYLGLWQRVLARVEDSEEMARQIERYRRAKGREG